MTTKIKCKTLGGVEVIYVSDYDPKYGLMDTIVQIGNAQICVICGEQINEFHNKLEKVINNYRI